MTAKRFKAGDKVKIVYEPSLSYGKIATYVKHDGFNHVIELDGTEYLYGLNSSLKLVSDTKDFKIGDRVRYIGSSQGIPYGVEGIIDNIGVEFDWVHVNTGNPNTDFTAFFQNLELIEHPNASIPVVNEDEDFAKHYKYYYKGIKIDPYRIFNIYSISDAAMQHAIKKLLRAGNSVKSLEQDIKEVIVTLERKLEMLKEDSE